MEEAAEQLGIRLPRNPYDVIYTFRFRAPIPEALASKAPPGQQWILRTAGGGRYRLVAISVEATIAPDPLITETKIPDATPGLIGLYALDDEQALLASI